MAQFLREVPSRGAQEHWVTLQARARSFARSCLKGQYGQEEVAGFRLFCAALIRFEEKSAATHAYKRMDRATAPLRLWTRSLL